MGPSRRSRFRIAVAVLLCLLFQQVAMAAYACPLKQPPATARVMVEDCARMGMEGAMDPTALCQKHCAPDHTVIVDHAVPTVPALALPPPPFALVLSQPASRVAPRADVPIARSDPPPRLQYCSLLI